MRALQLCVGDPEAFLADGFGREPQLTRPAGGERSRFDELLTLSAVDHLITSTALRSPAFRLVKDGKPLPPSSYTASPRVGTAAMTGAADPSKVLDQIDAGATLVLQALHRYWPPLRDLCRGLEADLGHPCQVNAYVTPPGARGLAVHSDTHDVFVLQVFGTKQWEIHCPRMHTYGEPGLSSTGGSRWDAYLEPGDALYLPRGTPHAARAQQTLSGHVTIGVHTRRWRDLLSSEVTRVLASHEFDEPLPVGYHEHPENFAADVRSHLDLLRKHLEHLDHSGSMERAADRLLTTRPSVLAGGLLDRVRLVDLADDSRVRRRAGAICVLRRRGDRLALLLGDRELTVPGWLEPAVVHLSSGDPVRLADLDMIDPQSRLVLARRLIREGLLEVVAE